MSVLNNIVEHPSPIFPHLMLDRKFWTTVVSTINSTVGYKTPNNSFTQPPSTAMARMELFTPPSLITSMRDNTPPDSARLSLESPSSGGGLPLGDKYITAATNHRTRFHTKLFSEYSTEGVMMERTGLQEVLALFGAPASEAVCQLLIERATHGGGVLDEMSFSIVVRSVELVIASCADSAVGSLEHYTPRAMFDIERPSPSPRRRRREPASVRPTLKTLQHKSYVEEKVVARRAEDIRQSRSCSPMKRSTSPNIIVSLPTTNDTFQPVPKHYLLQKNKLHPPQLHQSAHFDASQTLEISRGELFNTSSVFRRSSTPQRGPVPPLLLAGVTTSPQTTTPSSLKSEPVAPGVSPRRAELLLPRNRNEPGTPMAIRDRPTPRGQQQQSTPRQQPQTTRCLSPQQFQREAEKLMEIKAQENQAKADFLQAAKARQCATQQRIKKFLGNK